MLYNLSVFNNGSSLSLPPHFLSLSSYYHSSNSLSFFTHFSFLTSQTHYSGKHSVVCLASRKKPRPSRKLMSDEDLCNSLREFLALVGLPEGHVPSTKQLIQQGRKDLANIVRRRGHKLIEDLLADTAKTATDGYGLREDLNAEFSGSNTHDESGQEEKVIDTGEESVGLVNNDSSVNASLVMTSHSVVSSDRECPSRMESPASLQEKVENFMKYGLLDAVEDDLCGDLKGNDVEHQKVSSDGDNSVGLEPMLHGEGKTSGLAHVSGNSPGLNGTLMLQRPIFPPTTEVKDTRNIQLSTQRDQNTGLDRESAETSKMENELEMTRLKHMLQQKELELSRLKEDIESEKQALLSLQTKVEDEITKAQQLISEKEAELLAAEESLSGLVEAKIQYSGEGHVVEVAGSFNGWHQRIKLDPQISSVIIHPIGSRKSRLWSTTLWLYPGVYEVKFIVDGDWKIDPNRETTFRGGLENNILRVDQ